jgi:hypothetical protein
MRVMWQTDEWLRVRDIRQRLDYAPVGHTTVSKVAGILYQKGLLTRRLGDRGGTPGPPAWWYRAARPASEHIGALIATLLDLSPDPDATLDYALRLAITGTFEDPHNLRAPARSLSCVSWVVADWLGRTI